MPESTSGNGSNPDLLSTKSSFIPPQSNPVDIELDTPRNIIAQHPFSSSTPLSSSPITTNEDDALINRISSLLTTYLISRQSTATALITSSNVHEHETNSNLSDSAISLSTGGATGPINSIAAISNSLSSSIVSNEVDKLLKRVKTAVDNRLSIEITSNNHMNAPKNIQPSLSSSHIKTATINRRQQLFALHAVSCQERPTDDFDVEQSTSSNNKHKLDLSSKSQSFDTSTLSKHDIKILTFIMLEFISSY